jgi:hypothetical protein
VEAEGSKHTEFRNLLAALAAGSKSGLVDCGRGLFHANLVRPPNCRVGKQHRTTRKHVIQQFAPQELRTEYTHGDDV